MKFGKIIFTALIAVCASGAARAQNWSGFYIGVNAGHVRAESDMHTTVAFSSTGYLTGDEVNAINSAGVGSVEPSGFTGGITMGYNWQWGKGFFGFEGDYNHFNQGDSRTITFADPFCVGCSYTLWQKVQVNRLAGFRVRGGWASPRWLIYGTAGAAHTSYTYREVFTDTFANAYETSRQSRSTGGFVWGGGAEVKFGKHWSLKGEYLSAHFSKVAGPGGTLSTTTAGVVTYWDDPFTHSADLSLDMARVGVNFRF